MFEGTRTILADHEKLKKSKKRDTSNDDYDWRGGGDSADAVLSSLLVNMKRSERAPGEGSTGAGGGGEKARIWRS